MFSLRVQHILVAVGLLLSLSKVESANILLSGVFGDGSHYFTMVPIGNSLVKRGHNVTFLISDDYSDRVLKDPEHATIFNFETFHLPDLKNRMDYMFNQNAELTFAKDKTSRLFEMRNLFTSVNKEACEAVFEDQSLLDRLAKFDAFVVDVIWTCGVYAKSFLTRHRGAKNINAIVLAPMTPLPYIFQEAGSPFTPSYQPVPLTAFTSDMTFLQRLLNTITHVFFVFIGNKMAITGFLTGLVDQYDLDPRLKSTISNHVDLYLINVDFSAEFPFPLMPNIIPVGGLTTRPAKALESELEHFMQSSGNHGVVLFSLGTYFASVANKNPDIIRMFIDAFSRIPHKVLLHLKVLPPYKLPDNIKAMKWLPLNDLLGHSQTRAVVYHGGNNGFLEALYHGVPLVVMPLGADQYDVTARVLANGIGTKIDKDRLSTDYIYQQLNEVLENPSYTANAKRLSAIFRDRPMTPADTAAFWVEHVIKHGGDHLHPPTHNLSFFQIYLFDVTAFIILVIVILFLIIKRSVRWCCCRKKSVKSKHD